MLVRGLRGAALVAVLLLPAAAAPGRVAHARATPRATPVGCDAARCVARTLTIRTSVVALAVATRAHRVFVRNDDGTVSVVDPERGVVRTVVVSTAEADGAARPAVAVADRTGRVFVTSADALTVLDAATGAPVRTLALDACLGLVVADESANHVFVVTGLRSVTMLDARSGAVLHTTPLPASASALAVDARRGQVAVATEAGLSLLDAARGTLRRTTRAVLGGALAVDEGSGRIFVASSADGANSVSMFDARTGALVRTLGAAQGYRNDTVMTVAVDERVGRVLVVGSYIDLLDGRSGAVLTAFHIPRTGPGGLAMASALDPRTGRLFVPIGYSGVDSSDTAGHPGTVSVLDTRTAQVLTTIPVSPNPVAVATDVDAGRVLVISQGGPTATNGTTPGVLTVLDAAAGQRPIPSPASSAAPLPGARYFPTVRHNLAGPFLAYWQRFGGRGVLGLPRTEVFTEGGRRMQYTDHFLLHEAGGQVAPAPLGRLLSAGRVFPRVAPFASTPERLYVAATGHSLAGRFLAYWRAHEGAALLGAPLSEVVVEGNGDNTGRRYPTQWFARGRLEYHAEHAGGRYAVELGLLGVEALRQRGWLPSR